MLRNNIIIFFLLILFQQGLFCSNVFNDIKIYNYQERIIIQGIDSGFTKVVTIYGLSKNKSYFVPVALDQSNDSFTDFKLYYKKRSKYKEVLNPKLIDSPSFIHFYTSAIFKALELDSGKYFSCTFKIKCKNLILFNCINLSSLYDTDTANYEISIPKNLSLRYDSVNFDSLKFHQINFSFVNDTQIIKIKAKPYFYNNYKQSISSNRIPVIRLIVVPIDKKGKEEIFFNNWYISSIDSVSQLNKKSKRIIDSLVLSCPKNDSIIYLFYNYVKSRFKYLDVEVGMGSFIPHDVNVVLKNKQGDCKDLANLLRNMLSYKGFDAMLALTSTNNYFCDFNFPSLCSGNHVICVVKLDTGLILLDATDFNHIIGRTIQHLQGRTLFITSNDNPSFYRVPILNPKENEYNIKLNLSNKGSYLEGCLNISSHGFVDSNLKWYYSRNSNFEFLEIVRHELQEIFHVKEIDSIKYFINNDSIFVQAKIKYFNKQYQSNHLMYFFLDYIPSIFSNDFHKNKIENEVYLGSTILKKFTMTITLGKQIKDVEFTPMIEENSCYKLQFNAIKLSDNSININYIFEYNKIWINSNELNIINKLIDKFNKKIHETVVVHF